MSLSRAKTSGWASFGYKQHKQKQGIEIESDDEPYPPISSSIPILLPSQNLGNNNNIPARPFSSVLAPCANHSTLTVRNSSTHYGKGLTVKIIKENNVDKDCKKLQELHPWAESSLIKDVMVGVNSDVDKASSLLSSMNYSESLEGNKVGNLEASNSISEVLILDQETLPTDTGTLQEGTTDLAEISCALDRCLNHKNKELSDGSDVSRKKLSDASSHMKLAMDNFKFIPLEPEWEEDDIYFTHRKDALRVTRSASRFSKAATDAYYKGDHLSARQFSLKAQDEWMTAQKLNAKASKEILSIRNQSNDIWKLDLHGLHVAEAVQALQEHLQKIETQRPSNHSVCPIRGNNEGILLSASRESLCTGDMDIQQAFRKRPSSLQVITGQGNHSREEATLPIAIRNFLVENGYQYDETRPGVIAVRPKFCCK